jgi:hypothetical protein
VDDNLEPYEIQNMSMWSYETVTRIIKAYKREKPILIHCHAGIQRSAAITAMTLIILKNTSSDKAIAYIRKRRPIAFRPRINFHAAILQFENTIRLKVRQAQSSRPMSAPAFTSHFSSHVVPLPTIPETTVSHPRTEFRYQGNPEPAFTSRLRPIY